MSRRTFGLVSFSLAIALSIAAICAAEDPAPQPTGTVIGKLVNPAGDAVADCIVTATENAKKMRNPKDVASDADGAFKIDLPEGKWNMTFRTRDGKLKGVKSAKVVEGRTVDVGTVKLRAGK
jgi:flagellar basal body rod protein FlgG